MDWTLLDHPRTHLPEHEMAVRMLLAALLGAVIGFDREMKGRDAGLRTHMLVAVAASVFTIITMELFHFARERSPAGVPSDPIRIIEAVTAGVAFLAAGAIIQSRGQVQGLTTGAAMWMAGALGVASGAGFYALGVIATAITFVILALVRWGETRLFSGKSSEAHTKDEAKEKAPAAPS